MSPVNEQYETVGNPGRSFEELRDSGLLWLINTTVFHPRGFALALHYQDLGGEPGEALGWSLLGDGSEPWRFGSSVDADIDDCFRRVNQFFSEAGR